MVLLVGMRIYVGNVSTLWDPVNVELQGMSTEREKNICMFAFRDDYVPGK
jgi:hypothetical protein